MAATENTAAERIADHRARTESSCVNCGEKVVRMSGGWGHSIGSVADLPLDGSGCHNPQPAGAVSR